MTEIPIEPKLFWGLFYFLCVAFSVAVVYVILLPRRRKGDPLDNLKSKLGAAGVSDGLMLFFILLWFVISLSLTAGLLLMIWELIWHIAPATQGDYSDLRFALVRLAAFTATLGAVVALPFTVIRLKLTSEQTNTAIESLFNDKINAATDDLHAIRQVSKKMRGTNGEKEMKTLWQDDITRRNAAIDRLEGLAKERPDAAPRISRLLSVYVRELSREYPPVETPKDATPDELRDWASTLTVQRSDMENAVQVLGRLRFIDQVDPMAITIDLRDTNLQGFDLENLQMKNAAFSKATLQGANFNGAEMEEADLDDAQMQGANLVYTQMQGANLTDAQMQGSYLSRARMQGAYLRYAQMQGANLRYAQMQGADLSFAQMQGTNLSGAEMQGADLGDTQMRGADLSTAKMQGASLGNAAMQGTNLTGAKLDEHTNLTEATLQSAAVSSADYTETPQMLDFLEDIFGDGSVTLPLETAWPTHWPEHELEVFFEFDIEWEKWRDDPDNYEPPVLEDSQTTKAAE